ncbi:hypothetical protein V4S28_03735 [Enterococcus cecorum]
MMKNKIMKLFLVSTLGILSLVGVVRADNHTDTTWSNQYRVWSPNDHTPARKKTNTTSMYNKTNSLSGGVGYITIWAALYDGRDASGGHNYRSYVWNDYSIME